MSDIQSSATLRIHEGKTAEFKEIAAQCLAIVKEKDPGTKQYDWFMNADESVCSVRERYGSSEDFQAHMGNLGEALGKLLGLCDMRLEIFGDPSEEIRAALEGLDVTYYSQFLSKD